MFETKNPTYAGFNFNVYKFNFMDIPFYKCDAYGNTFIIAYHNNTINKSIFDSNKINKSTVLSKIQSTQPIPLLATASYIVFLLINIFIIKIF